MTSNHVAEWVQNNPLSPVYIDCTTAIMLKILDGKCKMAAAEKRVMAELYKQVKTHPGLNLGADIHHLIARAQSHADEAMKTFIYEKRVLAETMISRPVMKGFKAMIRQQGLLDDAQDEEEESA
ncbi:MAG: hypothetical protein IPJ38_10365 [Dechloromonas sp.]|uniref:Uncharacterized protein n=1 Tax=Candidatus Dechloromonas phosphorivorans TaxID=2899244 RepID=A0A935K4D9_9RHOO|nr:hypothetical protein [Candidatus Dechloromonas phosphorivorans]